MTRVSWSTKQAATCQHSNARLPEIHYGIHAALHCIRRKPNAANAPGRWGPRPALGRQKWPPWLQSGSYQETSSTCCNAYISVWNWYTRFLNCASGSQAATANRQSIIISAERIINLPCQEEPPILCASSACSTGSRSRSGIAAAGGGVELLEAPRVGGGGWGGDGGGSGRRKSEAAGLEERRGGPRGDGDGPGREEERKGGRHGHGSSGGNGEDGGGFCQAFPR
jgi:hypothetical protein